jgi:hypothetical protein
VDVLSRLQSTTADHFVRLKFIEKPITVMRPILALLIVIIMISAALTAVGLFLYQMGFFS